ncbi:E3 SUMO-protein ligase ZBED1-like isoform X2 [Lycorma delicatula]|uniref:E3 SUMO-protein ligase ZBED1-like isoform X2 n=1 Tax=Lycorma delicatula TaxID=130591 RepID=UPI003F512FB7
MGTPKKRLVSVIEAASENVHDVKVGSSSANSDLHEKQILLTQLLDDKHTFVYKKLVVPMNMRSIYWKCYGFPANEDGEILTKVKIVCILCKTVISYNGNTSNLRMHLRSKHPQLELQVQSDQSVFERKTISDAIAEFITMDLQLPDVVETAGFQRLVATLRSPCEIPSKIKLVEDVIPKLYDTFKESVLINLNAASSDIAISIEEWKSDNSETNITIAAHYLQQELEDQLQSKVLLTHHCSQLFNSEHWCHMFDNLLNDWGIKFNKVKAIVVATEQELLLSALKLRGFVLIPCLIYTLQSVCMKGCFTLPVVSEVINKVRLLLTLIYRNSSALTSLRIQEHVLQLEDIPLTLDYPKIWISTYIMLEQLLARRSIMKSVIDAIDSVSYERELMNISDDDWCVIEDIVTVLEPFKVTTMTLAEEKSPLISLLKPLMWQLISVHLKVRDDSDSDLSKQMKIMLTKLLTEKYSDESVDTILKTATTLDPRFKQLPYSVEESKVMLNGPIKVQLTDMMEQCNDVNDSKDGDGQQNTLKKTRLSGMEFLLGDLCTTSNSLSVSERAELEVTQYQSEPTANLDHCPLQWWQKAVGKFPNLAKLASSYNCIPATAIPPNRIPVEPQISFDMKRAKIFPEILDKLLFLNANRPNYI